MSIAEQYEDFIASLEDRGIPNPRVLVPAIAVIIILAIGYFALSGGMPGLPGATKEKKAVTLYVKDASTHAGVAGAFVTLGGKTLATDSSGMVSFSDVPADALRVTVRASNYDELTTAVPASGELSLSTAQKTPSQLNVLVQVRDAQDNDVAGAFVSLYAESGSALASGLTNSFGEANLKIDEDSVPETATLKVEKDGFKTATRAVSRDEMTSYAVNVQLELPNQQGFEPAADEGKLVIHASDADGNAVEGATVSLLDYYTNAVLRSARSAQDGSAAFDGIKFGKRLLVRVTHASYDDYSSEAEGFSATNFEYYASLERKTVSEANALSLQIVDEAGAPIPYATVSVYDRSTRALLATQGTDDAGATAVYAKRGKALFVTAFSEGFLPGFDELAQAGDSKTLVLEREAAGNFVDVPVTVKQDGEPAPGAGAAVFRADGFPLGVPDAATDADGVAQFRLPSRLKGADYEAYASASLDALHGKSDLSSVVEGAEFFVALQPDPAALRVEVRDVSTNETVAGAVVTIKPSAGGEARCVFAQGKNYCEAGIAPNQEFVLTASAADYLPATTSSLVLAPNEKAVFVILVYPLSLARGASLRFEGVFDAAGRQVKEVGNAAFYEARFLVTVPKAAEQAFFFASVGDAASVDEDAVGISSFDSDSAPFVYSGVNDALGGAESCAGASQSSEEEAKGAGEARVSETADGLKKWVNIQLPKNFLGTKEFALRVFVKPGVRAGSKIVFRSRLAGASKNAPFLSPASDEKISALLDKVLGGSALAASDFCDAGVRSDSVTVSKNLLYCDEGLCQQLVFEDENGAQSQDSINVELGAEFLLAYTLASEDKEISGLGIQTGEAVTFLGKETIEMNMSSAAACGAAAASAALDFAGENANAASVQRLPARAAPGERLSGLLRFKAVRTSVLAPITLTVYYADKGEKPAALQAGVAVTGTNSFRVEYKPASLVVGLPENARVTVRDSLGAAVGDANVLFFECDGSPLNGREIQIQGDGSINKGADGVYRARLSASSVGAIGLRVSREGFKTREECEINVVAGEFLRVEPETLSIEGDSSAPERLAKDVAVYSTLPVQSRVSTRVSCFERSAIPEPQPIEPPIYVIPQSFVLKESAKVQVAVKQGAVAYADCKIVFHGEVNPQNSFEAVVEAQVKLTTPPVVQACPLDKGFKCISPNDIPSNCYPQPEYECEGGTSKNLLCAVCDYGMHTLPESFELTVGETKPTDSQSSEIALDSKPKCKLEGFEDSPSSLSVSGYSSLYGSTPSNYWDYQPNQYSASSPYGGSYSPYSYQNYYGAGYGGSSYGAGASGGVAGSYGTGYSTGYGTGYGAAGAGVNFGTAYGSGYGYGSSGYGGYGTGSAGTYCPPTLNSQSMYSSYYSSSYQSPWNAGYPTGNSQSCQYPYVCQSGAGAYCSFTASGSASYGFSAGYSQYGSACSYPAICSNPGACPSLSSYGSYGNYGNNYNPYGGYGGGNNYNRFNYPQSKPPVSVSVTECTPTELTLAAEYTGADYFYNGAMGGEQNGFLVVTWKGDTKKIPVKVTVKSPSQFMRYPQTPIPFTPMMPSYCLPGVGQRAAVEGLDDYGLPEDVTVKINSATGEGDYERKISLSAGVLCKELKVGEKTSSKTLKCSTSALSIKLKYPESSRAGLSDSGSFKAYVAGREQKEYSFEVTNDDLVPQGKITLYDDERSWQSEETDVLEKAKCSVSGASGIKASCKNSVLNVSWDGKTAGKATVKITNAGDYNVREIPVETKKEKFASLDGVTAVYFKPDKTVRVSGLTQLPEKAESIKFEAFTDEKCSASFKSASVKRTQEDVSMELPDAKATTPETAGAAGDAGTKDYWFKVSAKVEDKDASASGATGASATKSVSTPCTQITVKNEKANAAGAAGGDGGWSAGGGDGGGSGTAPAAAGEVRIDSLELADLQTNSFKLTGSFSGDASAWRNYDLRFVYNEGGNEIKQEPALGSYTSGDGIFSFNGNSFALSCTAQSCPKTVNTLKQASTGSPTEAYFELAAKKDPAVVLSTKRTANFIGKFKTALQSVSIATRIDDSSVLVKFKTGTQFEQSQQNFAVVKFDGARREFYVWPAMHCYASPTSTKRVLGKIFGALIIMPMIVLFITDKTHHLYFQVDELDFASGRVTDKNACTVPASLFTPFGFSFFPGLAVGSAERLVARALAYNRKWGCKTSDGAAIIAEVVTQDDTKCAKTGVSTNRGYADLCRIGGMQDISGMDSCADGVTIIKFTYVAPKSAVAKLSEIKSDDAAVRARAEKLAPEIERIRNDAALTQDEKEAAIQELVASGQAGGGGSSGAG